MAGVRTFNGPQHLPKHVAVHDIAPTAKGAYFYGIISNYPAPGEPLDEHG